MPHLFLRRRQEIKTVGHRIFSHIHTPLLDLKVEGFLTPEPVPYTKRTSGKRVAMAPGVKWGGLFDCAWFHVTGTVPREAAGRRVVALVDLNGEGCVFDAKGNPVLGLTNKGSNPPGGWYAMGKRIVPVTKRARGGEKVDLWIDAGCNDLFGNLVNNGLFGGASLAAVNDEMRALYYDFEVLEDLMQSLPEESARGHQALYALHRASLLLKDYTEDEARAMRRILAPELARKNGDNAPLVASAVGHAHIDLIWLWPERETVRKCARTFSTALAMMERYPDYVFGQSQPQSYAWMKERYPGLYRRIKARVAEGRWEAQGCMWVEADTNLAGGEALVRQVLHGKRFYRAEFGMDLRYLWLPDVFGYSAALPQILKKAGVDYFMTQKMSWSKFNKFPHHTFFWKGLDGSRVLAHMLPEDNYNSEAKPGQMAYAERNYLDKGVCGNFLVLHGVGDGGGGPGEEHLERLAREKNLLGMVPIVQETAERFFERIDRPGADYQEWRGELYLEYHQGTFTSQARNKRMNRRMEQLLREVEFAASAAALVAGARYPQARLDAIWKEVLLYQFHDCLPGSSIARVYAESLARYDVLEKETLGLLDAARAAVAKSVDTSAARQPFVVWNSLSWDRTEWVKAGRRWVNATVPSLGYAVLDAASATPEVEGLKATSRELENDCLRVRFDAAGAIVSILDKTTGREALAPGETGNRLLIFHDANPGDAWDIAVHYEEMEPTDVALESAEARIEGPRAVLRQVRRYGESTLTQEIVLTAGSPRLDFVTEVDWRERNRMLRVQFPVAVDAAEAACDIQFGHVWRSTHRNTSWDKAKYEVPAHKWIDMSERTHGVALLNDCKYGHRVRGHVLDLNLLRSTDHPDPKADLAVHRFTYALLPHEGDHVTGGVIQEAYALNMPMAAAPVAKPSRGGEPAERSFLSVEVVAAADAAAAAAASGDPCAIIVEAVKKAEDGDAMIVRLYESQGGSVQARVTFGFPVRRVSLVNLMEEEPKALRVTRNAVTVAFGPFEIQTLKVER